jgi:hypothetical protein
MKPKQCILTPKIGVGPIRLGEPFENMALREGFELTDPNLDVIGDSWARCEACNLAVFQDMDEPGYVESILCDSFLYYRGGNLIGMTWQSALVHLQTGTHQILEPLEMPDGTTQTPVQFEELGLTLWLTDNVVAAATVDDGDYDD